MEKGSRDNHAPCVNSEYLELSVSYLCYHDYYSLFITYSFWVMWFPGVEPLLLYFCKQSFFVFCQ